MQGADGCVGAAPDRFWLKKQCRLYGAVPEHALERFATIRGRWLFSAQTLRFHLPDVALFQVGFDWDPSAARGIRFNG